MAATPSTTTPRRPTRFNSDPVESPFPFSPLGTSPQPLSQHINNNSNKNEFTSSQLLREITTIFQLFNPTLSGYLDVETFEVMMLSLGYRVTRQEIVGMVRDILLSCRDERDNAQDVFLQDENPSSTTTTIIDLSMAIEILSRKGYATQQRNSEEEARIYFGLFDVQNKGYITVEDLKRVQLEAVQLEQKMLSSSSTSSSSFAESNSLMCSTDEFVQAILDKFDVNSTGAIEFEEFRRIVNPILS
jgi:Ca2+-binding EF-hand superfamily protein